jgi:glycosyltransferase involved in cell wall biosynthesis
MNLLSIEQLPVVSVFTPIFNNASLVIPAIDSLRKQTYPQERIQHLIVDDGSSDDSVSKISDYIKNTNYECVFVVNPNNIGICRSYNMMIDGYAKGEFIIALADDIWVADKLERNINELIESGHSYAAVYSDMKLCDVNGEPLPGTYFSAYSDYFRSRGISPVSGNIFPHLIDGNFITAPTVLKRLSAVRDVGGFDGRLKFEDYDMYLRLAKKYKFLYSESADVTYRLHSNNFHKTAGDVSEDTFRVYDKHSENPKALRRAMKIWNRVYRKNPSLARDLLGESNASKGFLGSVICFFANMKFPRIVLRLLTKILYQV